MLTDYHVHLRPDELDASPDEYFTDANVERYTQAAAAAGIGELGRLRAHPPLHGFTDDLGSPVLAAERERRSRRLLRVRRLDTAAPRDRDGLRRRARGPNRQRPRRARLRLRRRLGALRPQRGGRRRRLRHLGVGRRPRPRLEALLRHPCGGHRAPASTTSPPTPIWSSSGATPGRRPPATRAFSTSRRSRRSPRPIPRSSSRPLAGESRWPSSTRRAAFAEMCIDAGAAFALSSDAHVPEQLGFEYERAVATLRDWGVEEIAVFEGRDATHGAARLMRVGIGYDSHRFAPGRRLVLGGVEIEHDQGLEGHSDADVITHAVIDALLGAAGLGDLGTHFPPDDENLARCRLARSPADRARDARRPGRQRRRDGDLRGAEARSAPRRDRAQPQRGDRRARKRQGDDQRGHGFRRAAERESPASQWRSSRAPPTRVSPMDLDRPKSLARRVKLGSLGSLPRGAVQRPNAARGRRDPADAPGQARASRPRARALGRLAGRRDHRRRDHPPRRGGPDRREGRAHLRRTRSPLERARAGARGGGRGARRRDRDHDPQPPRLRRRDARGLEARRPRPLHEHGVLGPAAGRRDGARGPEGPDLRRRVLGAPR